MKKKAFRKLERNVDELTREVTRHIESEGRLIKILENHSERINTLQRAVPALHPDPLELPGYS